MNNNNENSQRKKRYGVWSHARRISKLYRDTDAKLFFRLNPGDSLHEIVELFTDSENYLFVGYRLNDGSGYFKQYALIGKQLTREDKEEAVN